MLEHHRRLRKLVLSVTAVSLMALHASTALADPQGEHIVAGNVTVERPSDTKTEIIQSTDKAIINWQSFDIDADEWTEFKQPNRQAITLNRVVGGDPSEILGRLSANGNIMLINPDGILFGKDAQIDVGGLVATTHDITDESFLNGHYVFDQPGNPKASIIVEGNISIADKGMAAFVAPGVANQGIIAARLGKVELAAGNGFTLDMFGDELIKLKVNDEISEEVVDLATGKPLSALVSNEGEISANGGQVVLTAATARRVVDNVINNTGKLEATSVGTKNGKIVLSAQTAATKTPQAPAQIVHVSGQLDASGVGSEETGGDIHIIGEMINVQSAKLDARGHAGGGTILVGGDYLGGDPDPEIVERYNIRMEDEEIPTATHVVVDENTRMDASAVEAGNGGKVVNWADVSTKFLGEIKATGGSEGGDGGFVEVSGAYALGFDGDVDARAVKGKTGTFLMDPLTLIIDSFRDSDMEIFTTEKGDRVFEHPFPEEQEEYYIRSGRIESILQKSNISLIVDGGYERILDEDTFETEWVSGDGIIRINAPIKAPSNSANLDFIVWGGGAIHVNNVLDFSNSRGVLSFSAWHNAKDNDNRTRIYAGAGGKIIGNTGIIAFNNMNGVGTPGSYLNIDVIPDSDSMGRIPYCAHDFQCADDGTKIAIPLSSFNDNGVYIRINKRADVPDLEPEEPATDIEADEKNNQEVDVTNVDDGSQTEQFVNNDTPKEPSANDNPLPENDQDTTPENLNEIETASGDTQSNGDGKNSNSQEDNLTNKMMKKLLETKVQTDPKSKKRLGLVKKVKKWFGWVASANKIRTAVSKANEYQNNQLSDTLGDDSYEAVINAIEGVEGFDSGYMPGIGAYSAGKRSVAEYVAQGNVEAATVTNYKQLGDNNVSRDKALLQRIDEQRRKRWARKK